MEIGKEDSDEEKVAALSAVVSVGETLFVKVVEIKEDDGSGRYKLGRITLQGGCVSHPGGRGHGEAGMGRFVAGMVVNGFGEFLAAQQACSATSNHLCIYCIQPSLHLRMQLLFFLPTSHRCGKHKAIVCTMACQSVYPKAAVWREY